MRINGDRRSLDLHNAMYRRCIIKLYSRTFYNFINQWHPNTFIKKVKNKKPTADVGGKLATGRGVLAQEAGGQPWGAVAAGVRAEESRVPGRACGLRRQRCRGHWDGRAQEQHGWAALRWKGETRRCGNAAHGDTEETSNRPCVGPNGLAVSVGETPGEA